MEVIAMSKKSIVMSFGAVLVALMTFSGAVMGASVGLVSTSGTGFDSPDASTMGTVSYSDSGVAVEEGGSYTSVTHNLDRSPDTLNYDVGSLGDLGTNPTITAYDASDDSQIASASISATGTGSIDLSSSDATSIYYTISVADDGDSTAGESMTVASVDLSAPMQIEFSDSDATQTVATGETVTMDVSPSDAPSGASIAWDLDNDGNFDDSTGNTATVSESSTGTYSYTAQMTDSSGNTTTATYTLEVTEDGTSTGGSGAGGGSIPTQVLIIIGVVAVGAVALYKAEK
jgi:hypothetical protein